MIDADEIASPEPDPAHALELKEAPRDQFEAMFELMDRMLDFIVPIAHGPTIRRRRWACYFIACPHRNPANQQTLRNAAAELGVTVRHLHKLKAKASAHLAPSQKNKASLSHSGSFAGSPICPPFSHGKGEESRNARKRLRSLDGSLNRIRSPIHPMDTDLQCFKRINISIRFCI